MTTKAIEAGARAIYENWANYPACSNSDPWSEICENRHGQADDFRRKAKACIEAAIASGELVPASAVAAERERCAQFIDQRADRLLAKAKRTTSPSEKNCFGRGVELRQVAHALRALSPAPASGEFAVVPREPTREILDAIVAECKFAWGIGNREIKHVPFKWAGEWREVARPFYRAMLNAATKDGERA